MPPPFSHIKTLVIVNALNFTCPAIITWTRVFVWEKGGCLLVTPPAAGRALKSLRQAVKEIGDYLLIGHGQFEE